MKRLSLAFSVLLILVLYTFFAEKYVLDFCNDVDGILHDCALLITDEKYPQAQSTVSKLYDMWESNDEFLSIIVGDDTVREPQKSIVSIRLSFEDENYEECLITIRECQGYIHEISENNRISLFNLL